MTQRIIESLIAAGFTKQNGSHWTLDCGKQTFTVYYDGEHYVYQTDSTGSFYQTEFGETGLIHQLEFRRVQNVVAKVCG